MSDSHDKPSADADKPSSDASVGGANASGTSSAPDRSTRTLSPETQRRRRKQMRMMMFMGWGTPPSSDDDDDFMSHMDGLDDSDFRDMMMMRMRGRRRRRKEPQSTIFNYSSPPQERQESEKEKRHRQWCPPAMVLPDKVGEEEEEEMMKEGGEGGGRMVDVGKVVSDARLYTVEEKPENSPPVMHYLLKMPSEIPSALNADSACPKGATYNILMADVSGSMSSYWKHVMTSWNTHVAPTLRDRTDIYVFGTDVEFRRSGTELTQEDFRSGMTDLTGALQTIVEKVYQCKEKYVKVFIITDGGHSGTSVDPKTVIDVMREPMGKTCDVYLLGAGRHFPVQYSVDIRSRLHCGSANLPTLFWAQETDEVDKQMADIGSHLSNMSEVTLELSMEGYKLPGGAPLRKFHLLEWVYFRKDPEEEGGALRAASRRTRGSLELPRSTLTMDALLEAVRQWNGVAIQQHKRREAVPEDLLPLMERLFQSLASSAAAGRGVAHRLARIALKTTEVEFRTTLNKVREILTSQKFASDMQLAESILSATVTGGKFEAKVLKLKGHTDEDFKQDCRDFAKVWEGAKEGLRAVGVSPEDCCRVTLTSTLSDLQDEDFLLLLELDKYEFLRQFTLSGIPVFAPTRDAVGLNPWSYSIRGVLRAPYEILSQVALENFASGGGGAAGAVHKDVQLKADDPNTHFNAVVPVFTAEAARAMAPLVETRLFAMAATYAILKNPHYVDFSIHVAALAAVWVRMLFEFPDEPRPEFVARRVRSIFATAALYLRRPSLLGYCRLLRDEPPKALMTESTATLRERPVRCETLIKPMFLLRVLRGAPLGEEEEEEEGLLAGQQAALGGPLDDQQTARVVRLILLEYVGRCLSRSDLEATPFTDFFVQDFGSQESKKQWMQRYLQTAARETEGAAPLLLSEFYTFEEVEKAARRAAKRQVAGIKEQLKAALPIKVNLEKVARLRKVSLAGDVSWPTLRTFARDLGLAPDVLDDLFGERSVLVYVQHALRFRGSRERLEAPLASPEEALELVRRRVQEENAALLGRELQAELTAALASSWLTAYREAHAPVVSPMSRAQILAAAAERGVAVTEETFDQVYRKYRPHLGLLSNACQAPACPFFLQPSRRYNQHAVVERRNQAFPHAFHHVAHACRNDAPPAALRALRGGERRAREGRGQPVPSEAVSSLQEEMRRLQTIYQETTHR